MKVENLSKKIENRLIIDDISFQLKKGQIVGLIGRNGEGKTTLFRLLANHYNKSGGNIFIDEENIDRHRELYSEVFYLDGQYQSLHGMTPKAINKMYKELYPNFNSERFISLVETHHLPMGKTYRTYSKGMQGLLVIILALCSEASYILLDEPLDGLDFYVKKQALQLMLTEVAENEKCLLISSHNLLELEFIIDRALIIKKGQLVQDYLLDDMKSAMTKVQMIFPKSIIPDDVLENCQIIEQRGKVVVGLFTNLTSEMREHILTYNPILFESLPLSLEDLVATQVLDNQELGNQPEEAMRHE